MTESDVPRGIATELARMPPDRTLSPVTGWTRDHHERVADLSLLALRRWASPGRARLDLPGPASAAGPASDGLEGFARSFLAAAFRLAGSTSDPHDHAGFYADGLTAGPDPSAPDRWPRLDEVRQARVEAAAVAIALHESRARVWDRLDAGVQERLVGWLAGSIGSDYGDSNWRWFRCVTQAFLRSVGGPVDEQELADDLAFLDGCYLGDGWYTDGRPDGRGGNVDWYNPWVMQLFSLWYCRISGEAAAPRLLETSRARMAALLPQLVRLFGPDGAPLYQGRSLVYRFATTGAVWAGPVFGLDTVAPGEVRRVGSAALRWFVEHDAYDEHDLLSLGWLGRHEAMRQPYSGPGSPYWSSLGFAGLVLGEDHPVWTDPEPTAEPDATRAVEPVGWLVGAPADGIVRVVNHGVDHSGASPGPEDPQYCRLAYSTATAPVPVSPGAAVPEPVGTGWESGSGGTPDARSITAAGPGDALAGAGGDQARVGVGAVPAGGTGDPDGARGPGSAAAIQRGAIDPGPVPDNLVALRDAAGRWSQRRPITRTVVTGSLAGSRHDVVLMDGEGTLEPRPGEALHVWSVLRGAVEVRVAVLHAESPDPLPLTLVLSGWATPTEDVHRAPAVNTVHPLLGDLRVGRSVHDAENPFGRRLIVPWAAAEDVRPGAVQVVAVVLAEHEPPLPEVTLSGTVLEVRWPDGTGDRVELDVVDGN